MKAMPKYYLPDVPHDLRTRVLDLCVRRVWHEALELLRQHGFNQYERDDLISFYNSAPARLPEADPVAPPPPAPVEPGPPPTDNGPSAAPTPTNNAPDDPQRLHELRQRLVQLLIARAQSLASAQAEPVQVSKSDPPSSILHPPP